MNSTVLLSAAGDSIIQEGLVNMAIGLMVVFAVLAFLCLIIWAFKFINKAQASTEDVAAATDAPTPKAVATTANAPAAAKTPGTMKDQDVEIEGGIDADTAAVILGAVAQECGGDFKVTSIKKS